VAALARQYYEYGYWKAVVMRMHPESARLRQLVPPVAVLRWRAGVEHVDVGEVADRPTGVDQPPAQLDLLVAVVEIGEVPADVVVGRAPERARPPRKYATGATLRGSRSTEPGNVA
jgi:hypothetical protein